MPISKTLLNLLNEIPTPIKQLKDIENTFGSPILFASFV